MKNLKRIGFLAVLIMFVVSCACMKDKNTISGKVESIEFGKDGYTAKINTTKNGRHHQHGKSCMGHRQAIYFSIKNLSHAG